MPKTEHPLLQFKFCPKCGSRQFIIHDNKSKYCKKCGFTYYFNPSTATAAVIVNSNQEILVCRRAKEPAKGSLDLPGGFCDCYETAEEGILREVREETGLEVTIRKFLFSHPNLYLYSGFTVHTIDLFFLCDAPADAQPQAMDDAAECFWLPKEKIVPEDFGLNSIRAGIQYIQKNWENEVSKK